MAMTSLPTAYGIHGFSSPLNAKTKTKTETGKWSRQEWKRPAMAIGPESSAIIRQKEDLSSLKTELLAVVAGLDRGLSAKETDVEAVDMAAKKLEMDGDGFELPRDIDQIQGIWRLVYSSGFASGSLGGRRPGPPIGRLPLTLGQVYQRIDVVSKELDNIVDLQIGTLWPLPPLEAKATLAHTFEITGKNAIRIIFEKTSVKPEGYLSQVPSFVLPQLPDFLRPPSNAGSGYFETTYLEKGLRISRGDRGELRIFLRA